MSEAKQLLWLYDLGFTAEQRLAAYNGFIALCAAYPDKCHHSGGYTDLWLTAIADVRDGKSPWLDEGQAQ